MLKIVKEFIFSVKILKWFKSKKSMIFNVNDIRICYLYLVLVMICECIIGINVFLCIWWKIVSEIIIVSK